MYVKTLAYNYEQNKYKFKQFRVVSFKFDKINTAVFIELLKICNSFKPQDEFYNLDIIAIAKDDSNINWNNNPVNEDEISVWEYNESHYEIGLCNFVGIKV